MAFNWAALLKIAEFLVDRIPSRREALLNRIQELKDAIKKKQQKPKGAWTPTDSAEYYLLVDELSRLEKRAANID